MQVTIVLPVYFKESQMVVFYKKNLDMPFKKFYEGASISLGMFHNITYTICRVTPVLDKNVILSLNSMSARDSVVVLHLVRDGWVKMYSVDIGREIRQYNAAQQINIFKNNKR